MDSRVSSESPPLYYTMYHSLVPIVIRGVLPGALIARNSHRNEQSEWTCGQKRGQLFEGSNLWWKLQALECVSPEGYRSYPVWTLRRIDWLDGSSFGDRCVPVASRSGLLAAGAYVRTCSNGSICPHMTIRVECRTDLRKNIFMVFKKSLRKTK